MTGGGEEDGEPGHKTVLFTKGEDTGGDLARGSSKAAGGDSSKAAGADLARDSFKAAGGDHAHDSSKAAGGDSSKAAGGDRGPDSSKAAGGDRVPGSSKAAGGDRVPDSSKAAGGDRVPDSSKATGGDRVPDSSKDTVGDDSRVRLKCTTGYSLKRTSDSLKGPSDGFILSDEEVSHAEYLTHSLIHDIDGLLNKMETLKRAMCCAGCEEEVLPLKRSKAEGASMTASHLEVVSPRSKRNLEDEDQSEQILKRSKYDSPIVAESPWESSGLIVSLRSVMRRGKDLHLERRDVRLEKRELRLENREAWLANREVRLEKRERRLDRYENQKDQSLEQRKADFDKNWEGYQNWLLYKAALEDAPSASKVDGPSPAAEKVSAPAPKTSAPIAAPAPGNQTPGSLNRVADAVKTGVTTVTESLESADKMTTLLEKVVAAPTRVQDLRKSYEENKAIVSAMRKSYEDNTEVGSSFKSVVAGVVTSSLLLARQALKDLVRGGGGDGDAE